MTDTRRIVIGQVPILVAELFPEVWVAVVQAEGEPDVAAGASAEGAQQAAQRVYDNRQKQLTGEIADLIHETCSSFECPRAEYHLGTARNILDWADSRRWHPPIRPVPTASEEVPGNE